MQTFWFFVFLAFNLCSASNEVSLKETSYQEFRMHYKNDPHTLAKYPTQNSFNELIENGKEFPYIEKAIYEYVETLPKCPSREEFCYGDNSALIVTDMQKAFGTNGSVAVPGAENAIWAINHIKPWFKFVIHTMDTHLEWSDSFSLNPDYKNTFLPHARAGTDDFEQLEGLDTCADVYFGKEQFSVTSNPQFKKYVLEKNITRIVFTGVAGDFCVNGGIFGILEDPDFSHIEVGLYQPGVQWVFPKTIMSQMLSMERFEKFTWVKSERKLTEILNKNI